MYLCVGVSVQLLSFAGLIDNAAEQIEALSKELREEQGKVGALGGELSNAKADAHSAKVIYLICFTIYLRQSLYSRAGQNDSAPRPL